MSVPEKPQLVATSSDASPYDSPNERQETSSPPDLHGDDRHVASRNNLRWGRAVLHHVVCFAWLAPAVTLLVLNFEEYIVGASIGCFDCHVNPFSSSAFQTEATFNKRDHTALGGLQFASKVMEGWFLVAVSGLVYDLLVLLTAKGDDFPLGLLAKYLQIADLLSIVDYPKGVEAFMHYLFV